MRKGWLVWVPFAAFAVIALVVAAALWSPADRTVRSRLVGQAMPAVALPAMVAGKPGIGGGATGQARLVNIFASWCIPCRAEAPQLDALARAGVPIDGIAVRDTREAVGAFLRATGNPYARVGDDRDGRVQLSLGSSGVPESFLVDARGRIVAQHVGDIRAEEVTGLIAQWRAAR